ncbi:transposase [Streptomyces sp. A0592]|uniref:transposase n=1 Tax=Streptomyces sp. A0592 TaxID=2563099 RepID=UPI001F0D3CFD|nr:transposase [Streptomyces sp. A0592]
MFLPASWDGPAAVSRREACRIPADEHHQPKWRLAPDMLDELAGIGLRPAVVVADAGYGAALVRGRCRDTGPARSPCASMCWPPDGGRGGPWSGARGPKPR